jgi:DNA-binding transcriptional LysR family regulator
VTPLSLAALRALQSVARHGSFSRAAAELGLTQPAVSMQVRQLEHRVGLPLLERVGKRTRPTEAGELLMAHASRAFMELEAGLERVQQLRGIVAGRVRLGTSASISIYLLPPLLRRFRARYPDADLHIVTGNAPEIAASIARNELDLGIVSLPLRARELDVTPFYRDELVAIAPPRRDWRRRRAIQAAELAAGPLILFERGATLRRVIDEWFQHAGATPARVMEMGNTEAIKKLVQAGLGLSVTSWFSAKSEARSGALLARRLDPPLYRQLGLVRRRDKPGTPVLDAFVQALEELRSTLGRVRYERPED